MNSKPKTKSIKPLTSRDREQYIHRMRENEGRVTWTVNKSSFGQNDILGCIDTISYTQWDIILDQTSTVRHISDKRREIERMLHDAPETQLTLIFVHGIDGYREKQGTKWVPVITRHVTEKWIDSGEWEREEITPRRFLSTGQNHFDDTMRDNCTVDNHDALKSIVIKSMNTNGRY